MIVNSLLVQWANGWHEVTDAASVARHGRREGTLGLGASESLGEVETVARQQLAIFGDPRTEIGVDLQPAGPADTPYVAFSLGDTVVVPDYPGRPSTRERIVALTVAQDDNGVITYAPELKDVLLDDQERFAETLAKMANGTLGGNSKVGQPTASVSSAPSAPNCCPPTPPPPDPCA